MREKPFATSVPERTSRTPTRPLRPGHRTPACGRPGRTAAAVKRSRRPRVVIDPLVGARPERHRLFDRRSAFALQVAIGEIDPNLALFEVRSLEDILDRSAQMAFTMILIIIAASVALMLGVIGIYGVMSYIVSQRTGEIGVRLALGADPGDVAGMIVRQGGAVSLIGIAVGLGGAFA